MGIEHLRLVLGWSMGAGQTYQWGVSYPQMMDTLLPFCGSPRTAPHNIVFLESVRAAITADSTWRQGWYADQPKTGLCAAARVYAGWGFSQAFYWHEEWWTLGFTSLEDFLVGFWEEFFLGDRDANNLLAMLWTWQNGDVGRTPGFDGDTTAALASIQGRTIQMPDGQEGSSLAASRDRIDTTRKVSLRYTGWLLHIGRRRAHAGKHILMLILNGISSSVKQPPEISCVN